MSGAPGAAGTRLRTVVAPRRPRGVVLLLHGGAGGAEPLGVSSHQPSVLRMVPLAWRLAATTRGLAVVRVLNSFRGWHSSRTPVDDAVQALDELSGRYGRVPACLVGHSLGGRAAVLAAAERDHVRAVVALAPWVHADDGDALDGRRVLVVHGGRDAVAPEPRALAMARRLSARNEVGVVRIAEAGHALVREHRLVDGLAADFARVVLLDAPPRTRVLRRVLAGEDVVRI